MAGFFTMKIITMVSEQSDLAYAKMLAADAVDNCPQAKEQNTLKARTMIGRATSIKSLAIGMSNFLLANESKSLKVIS